jgi:hypothetical protein
MFFQGGDRSILSIRLMTFVLCIQLFFGLIHNNKIKEIVTFKLYFRKLVLRYLTFSCYIVTIGIRKCVAQDWK